MGKNEKKYGMFLSYIHIIVYSLTNIVLTPFLISHLGVTEYGIYQLISSFAGYLVIMNFGTGTVMTRYVALYLGKHDKNGEANFIAMCLIITGVLAVLIAILIALLYNGLGNIFSTSLTLIQLEKAKILYLIVAINVIVELISQALNGVALAYEKFVILNFLQIIRTIFKVTFVVLLISLGFNSIAIVSVDLLLSVVFLFWSIWYILCLLKVKIKLYKFDKTIFIDVAIFSFAIFFQSIVNQVNSNVDKTILGIMIGLQSVTLYSIAMNIFSVFSITSTVAISIYLPELTKMVANGADGEKLTDAIIPPSRIQTIISGSILFGFLLFGRDFIVVWMRSSSYLDAWFIGIIIMIPMFFNYTTGIVVSILDASRKRLFRSIVLGIMAILNVVISVLLVKKIGYLGAPVGTAIVTFVGQIVIMNIYYKKYININISRMFKEIFRGILPSLIIAAIMTLPFVYLIPLGLKGLIVKGGVFMIALSLSLYSKGFSVQEKQLFYRIFHKTINSGDEK